MLKGIKIVVCSLLLLGLTIQLNGQVRFQTTASIEGIYPVDRMFQFSVLNPSPLPTNGQVTIRLATLSGNELVAQYKSLPTIINSLENVVGSQMDWLKDISFGSSQAAAQFRDQGVLPYGQYVVCYSFFDGKTTTSPVCAEIYSKPQVPPRLNTPTDKEIILNTNPLLTWIPPMPDYGVGFQYDLRLVELRENQTCVQALEQNPPIVKERGQEETVYQINDANGLGLEIGKTYCWQVGAFTRSGNLGSTEMWQFTVGSTALTTLLADPYDPYILLKQAPDAECARAVNNVLRIAFDNRFGMAKFDYVLRKEDLTALNPIVEQYPKPIDKLSPQSSKLAPQTLVAGMNYINLTLPSTIVRNEPYVFELTDDNNVKYYCRFIY